MKCAYCGTEGKMTREHIIPNFIYKYEELMSNSSGWNEAANKITGSEHQIKDVCGKCNNGPLGSLDAYGKSFLENHGLLTQNFLETSVNLKYEYSLLLRWVLKISFNSARCTKKQSHLFEGLKNYMLTGNELPENRVAIMGQLLRSEIPSGGYLI